MTTSKQGVHKGLAGLKAAGRTLDARWPKQGLSYPLRRLPIHLPSVLALGLLCRPELRPTRLLSLGDFSACGRG